MDFDISIHIQCSPLEVFGFFRDIDQVQQEPDSPVLVLEKITPGPTGVGTRYREVIQMFPGVRGEMLSVISLFELEKRLEMDFTGPGMQGHIAYGFYSENGGTRLNQRESVQMSGILRLFEPLLRGMMGRRLKARLEGIKAYLEIASPLRGSR